MDATTGTVIAVAIATALSAAAYLLLVGWREPVDVEDLSRSLDARLRYGGGDPTLWPLNRVRTAVRRRLDDGERASWSLARYLAISLAAAAAAGGALYGVVGAPPFLMIGCGAGVYAVWAHLGRRADRRHEAMSAALVDGLDVVAGAAAAAIPPFKIVREILLRAAQPPLREVLERAVRRVDPDHGVATARLGDVLAEVDARVANQAFSLAREAIEEAESEGTDLVEPAALIAELARDDLLFRQNVRAHTARIRGTVAFIFAFPLVGTAAVRIVAPERVDAVYATLQGWGVAFAVVGACVACYYLMTSSERRIAREVGGQERTL